MTSRDLAALAVELVCQADEIVRCTPQLSRRAMIAYWSASKCRLDHWFRALRGCRTPTEPTPDTAANDDYRARTTILDTLQCEPLSRVWAAITAAHDRHHQRVESGPISHGVFLGHLEARRRALLWIEQWGGEDRSTAQQLLGVGRRVDRWTDLLLAALGCGFRAEEFAVDPRRVRDMQADGRLLLDSVGEGIARRSFPGAEHGAWMHDRASRATRRWNREIGISVLACLDSRWGGPVPRHRWHEAFITRLGYQVEDLSASIEHALSSAHAAD